MKKFILLFFSLLVLELHAQNTHCPTILSPENLQWLRSFQQQLDQNGLPAARLGTVYVPVKVHIVGNNEGKGYYSVSSLMQAMCDLNADFEPAGMHFYLAGDIDYINDNALYVGNSDAIWFRSEDYKDPRAVNVFFHGAGNQWCGVYFPGVDVVFVLNSCQGANATTLTHELGHFFSLPHTFSGWENDNVPSNIERLDGSNCRNAGDGFCDTKADYVSMRWGCPLAWNLKDPAGAFFKPDSSIYMSYSSDNCQSRFSQEQMAAMNANLNNRSISKATADTRILPEPKKRFPLNGSQNQNPEAVLLEWEAVPGAFAYQVQVARFGDWNFLNYDALVFDTTAVVKLFGTWEYAWRVKAITAANTCGSFGAADTFSTKAVPAGIVQLEPDMPIAVYPNPVSINEKVWLKVKQKTVLSLSDVNGKVLQSLVLEPNEPYQLQLPEVGVYFLLLQQEQGLKVKKLMVR